MSFCSKENCKRPAVPNTRWCRGHLEDLKYRMYHDPNYLAPADYRTPEQKRWDIKLWLRRKKGTRLV